MPTPLGHSLAGLAVHFASPTAARRSRWWPLFIVALANFPDIDFLPGYFVGAPRTYHWGPTHSVTAVLIAACVTGWVGRRFGLGFASAFLVAGAAYGSHVFLDLLVAVPPDPTLGLQLFWPFSTDRMMLPWHVFLAAPRGTGQGPLGLLFSVHAFPLFLRELVVLMPVVLAGWLAGRNRTSLEQVGS